MWSLLFVLIYQISSGSGSFLAASIIPARHWKAIRLPGCPADYHPHSQRTCPGRPSPLESSYQPLGTFSAGLSSGDFSPQPQEMGE